MLWELRTLFQGEQGQVAWAGVFASFSMSVTRLEMGCPVLVPLTTLASLGPG